MYILYTYIYIYIYIHIFIYIKCFYKYYLFSHDSSDIKFFELKPSGDSKWQPSRDSNLSVTHHSSSFVSYKNLGLFSKLYWKREIKQGG